MPKLHSQESKGDEVLLRLENPGGTVHEHGFAASQLLRIKDKGLKLVVAVDKVAASGGYLMACVAERGKALLTLRAVRSATDPAAAPRTLLDPAAPLDITLLDRVVEVLLDPRHPQVWACAP